MINVGIVGSEGYTVAELYSLVIKHPDVDLRMIYSPWRSGMNVSELYHDLHSMRTLRFTDEADFEGLDVLFICLPSGMSRAFLESHPMPEGIRVIDFGHEHRHSVDADKTFVYGLVEAYKDEIVDAQYVSVPGSFAEAVELPLLPLAREGLLQSDLHIHCVSGKTQAFARPEKDKGLSYEAIFDQMHVYSPFSHHQQDEIYRTLSDLQEGGFHQKISMIPMRGGFNRGMYSTIYMNSPLTAEEAERMYTDFFDPSAFIYVTDEYPDVRDTQNTNNTLIHLAKLDDKLLIVSSMDNLMKGAAGTAIHIMNTMFRLVETTGLELKFTSY